MNRRSSARIFHTHSSAAPEPCEKCGLALACVFLFAIIIYGACAVSPAAEDPEEETIAVTLWTDAFELFLEYPSLRVGRPARFAAHLTNLSTFEPVTSGPVTFAFRDGGQIVKEITLSEPIRPGIFIPEISFDRSGSLALDVIVQSPSQSGAIQVSPVEIYGVDESVPAAEEAPIRGDRIAYLKEQQWKLPFRTEAASRHSIRGSVHLHGKILAKPAGDFRVIPPLAGRFIPPADGPASLGQDVKKGLLLGWIEPTIPEAERVAIESARVQTGIALAQLDEKIADARALFIRREAELGMVRREIERVERLLRLEAVPQRRLETARSDLEIADANWNAAKSNLQNLLQARKGIQEPEDAGHAGRPRLALYAPGSGTVVESAAAAGAFMPSQHTLFRIVDLSRVWIRAEVHETDIGAVGSAAGRAQVRFPDNTTIEVGGTGDRLFLVGDVIDPETRTLPITFEAPNPDRRLKIGMVVGVQVFTVDERNALAVSSSAVFREENKSIVYVQVGGETFDRRIVETGLQDGELIEIRAGLSPGERVVVEGGYEVGLAARSTSGAGEGHIH